MKTVLSIYLLTTAISGLTKKRMLPKRSLSWLVTFSLLLTLMPLATVAQTIRYVKTGGSGMGTSWVNASGDLQAMINASSSGDQVWVAAGTYKPNSDPFDCTFNCGADPRNYTFRLRNGVAIYGGFAGNETALGQRNINSNPTILSGDIGAPGDKADNCYHVVLSVNNNNTAVLDGFTVQEGNANGNGSIVVTFQIVQMYGGGMYNQSSSPTVSNCTFLSNNSGFLGGGMINEEASSPIITNCKFLSNSAPSGGGIFNLISSSPIITNCTFWSNSATNGGGGGIGISTSSPTITNCTFSKNSSNSAGGGIFIAGSSSQVTMTNCILWGNTANGGPPQIMINQGALTITYSDVQGGYSGTGNLSADPLFVNAASGDLRLIGCSPVINQGLNSANTTSTDLDGNSRIFGGIIDMGAFEFQGSPPEPPAITTQPTGATVCAGSNVSFSATASNATGYQWQVNPGAGFVNLSNGAPYSGVTSATLTITGTPAGLNNNQYRVIASGTCASEISNEVTLTVNSPPDITTEPTGATTVCAGAQVTFTAAASGTPTPTVQWQKSLDGNSFSNITGATATTYSFTATASQHGHQYRAVFTNSCGSTPSVARTLTVNPNLSVNIPNVKALPAGVAENTVYPAYAPAASLTLTAQPSGGTAPYQYKWQVNGTGTVLGTSASLKVSPTVTTTYSVTVSASNACATTVYKIVQVVNASCGPKNKVLVCHNGQSTCVESKSVQDHLDHGDRLGSCSGSTTTSAPNRSDPAEAAVARQSLLRNYPNPISASTTIAFSLARDGEYTIDIFDASGRLIAHLSQGKTKAGNLNQVEWQPAHVPPGIYIARLTTATSVQQLKLLVR